MGQTLTLAPIVRLADGGIAPDWRAWGTTASAAYASAVRIATR